MSEQPPTPDHEADAGAGPPPGMPGWVKVSAIVVGVLILLFVVLRLTGVGGDHGPGRHMSGQALLSPSVSEGQPAAVGSPA